MKKLAEEQNVNFSNLFGEPRNVLVPYVWGLWCSSGGWLGDGGWGGGSSDKPWYKQKQQAPSSHIKAPHLDLGRGFTAVTVLQSRGCSLTPQQDSVQNIFYSSEINKSQGTTQALVLIKTLWSVQTELLAAAKELRAITVSVSDVRYTDWKCFHYQSLACF